MSSLGFSLRFWLAAGCVVSGLGGCSSSPPTTQVRTDGRLRVLPQEFTRDVGCSFASGDDSELGYYVATLVDLGQAPGTHDGTDVDTSDYPRVSSNGTVARCTSSTTFATRSGDTRLQANHLYVAIIDGYQATTPPELRRTRAASNWPAPHWQWLCGIGGLDEATLRWLMDQVNVLPRTATPSPATPRDAGAPTASSAQSHSHEAGADAGNRGDASPFSDASAPSTADAANPQTEENETDSGERSTQADAAALEPGRETVDAGSSNWSQLLQSAGLDGAPTPAQLVLGGQAGVRGCVLVD